MSRSNPILVLDNTFTFGGAIISLGYLLGALDKKKFPPVLVTGQSPEYLATHFADCHHYHYIPKLPWVDNQRYRKVASHPFFKIRPFLKILNLSRFIYWLVAINMPEAVKYRNLGRKYQVSIVHLNNIFGSQSAGILAAKLLGVPCVAHLRDFEEVHPITRFYAQIGRAHV